MMRDETDSLGTVQVPDGALYGANTLRGQQNFAGLGAPLRDYPGFIAALAKVKLAAAQANLAVGALTPDVAGAIVQACAEIAAGQHHAAFIVPLVEGSGGTSTNMNANEVIANRAGQILGDALGSYARVNPNDHVTRSQSTHDVVLTAIKLACVTASAPLLAAAGALALALRDKADAHRDILRVGRTCMQAAQPMTYGQLFDGWASGVERAMAELQSATTALCCVPMGGTAIGTGLGAAPGYRAAIAGCLSDVFGFAITRPADDFDAMQAADGFLRLSAELRNVSSVLAKYAADLVILGSDGAAGLGEVILPAVQPGSSIMAGKVNPVIPMALQQIAMRVHGADATVALAAQAGQMEINHFEPVMAEALFQQIGLVTEGCRIFADRCIASLRVDADRSWKNLSQSFAVSTVFLEKLGYKRVVALVKQAQAEGVPLAEIAVRQGLMNAAGVTAVLEDAAQSVV